MNIANGRVLEIELSDLIDLAMIRRLSTISGLARGVPSIITNLVERRDRADLESELGTIPAVLIGVGPSSHPAADHVDVLVDDRDEALSLAEQIGTRPNASVALALLLRHGDERNVAAGLVAESTTYSMLQNGAEFAAWRATRRRPQPVADLEPPVLVHRQQQTMHIELNRPLRHNAVSTELSEHLVEALTVALAEVREDMERLIVLSGRGPSFCSGGDIDEFGSFPDSVTAHSIRLARSAGHLVHLLGDRIEVRLHGACIGAGIELPAFARRVLAAADVQIALPEVGLGLIPGAGGTTSITRRIGRHRTAWLALTARTITAATALEWGLVDQII